jgi:hypothetical protein
VATLRPTAPPHTPFLMAPSKKTSKGQHTRPPARASGVRVLPRRSWLSSDSPGCWAGLCCASSVPLQVTTTDSTRSCRRSAHSRRPSRLLARTSGDGAGQRLPRSEILLEFHSRSAVEHDRWCG